MKTNILKSMGFLIALGAIMSSFAPMGAHSFKILLDDKQLTEQYATTSMAVPKIVIDPAENHKQLTVMYNECGRTVSGRVIKIKDSADKVIKEWRFDGTTSGYKDAMTCSVKEIVALKKNSLSLFYSSTDFPDGQKIATIVIGPGSNTASK